MSYWLEGFQVEGDDLIVVEIELTREQFEQIMGDRMKDYKGGPQFPANLDFYVGETRD